MVGGVPEEETGGVQGGRVLGSVNMNDADWGAVLERVSESESSEFPCHDDGQWFECQS